MSEQSKNKELGRRVALIEKLQLTRLEQATRIASLEKRLNILEHFLDKYHALATAEDRGISTSWELWLEFDDEVEALITARAACR